MKLFFRNRCAAAESAAARAKPAAARAEPAATCAKPAAVKVLADGTSTAAAVALAAAILFTSCDFSFLACETVNVRLPSPHPAILLAAPDARPSWTLRWYNAGGTCQIRSGVTDDTELVLERGVFTPVILVPETDTARIPAGSLPVAGSIYPILNGYAGDTSLIRETVLETSWTGGIAAILAESVCLHARGGFDTGRTIAGHFNWSRFIATLSEYEEPHRIDRERFTEAVLSGSFKKWDIRQTDTVEITFPRDLTSPAGIKGGSLFLPEWPDAPGFLWPEGGATILRASEGTSRWFGAEGSLVTGVEGGTLKEAFFEPYSLQD